MNTIPERKIWADNIRLIATLGVIILHVSSTGLYGFGKISTFDWMTANFADSITRYCVPLFFMLSGALILSKTESPLEFYKKRFTRVLLPFLFWSLIYGVACTALQYIKGNPTSIASFFTNILFYQGTFSQLAYHLWYIYVLIGIYILAPFIKPLLKTKSNLIAIILAWTISIILCLPFFSFNNTIILLFKFLCYTGYFIIGYILTKSELEFKIAQKTALWISATVLVLYTAISTFYLTSEDGKLNDTLYDYFSPNVVLFSVIIFLLIKSLKINLTEKNKVLSSINKYSYGIYLSHALFLSVSERAGLDWNFIHPFIGIPFVTIICLMLSLGLIFILKKIPVLRNLAG